MEQTKSQMPVHDNVTATGVCEVFTKKGGNWENKRRIENLTVDLGVNLVRDRLFTASTNYVKWGAVSDNTDVPAAGDTSLTGNETARTLFQNGEADVTTTKVAYVEFYLDSTEWAAGDPAALTTVSKAGLYYTAATASLYCAAKFDALNVDSATEMLVSWTVTYSDVA